MSNTISRRNFLKGMAAAAGAAGLSAMMPKPLTVSAAEKEEKGYDWSEAADVIVVGGGSAGFCAAIEAGRAGASVLILEKNSMCGGDSLLCGGMIMAGGTDFQKSLGIEDSVEAFVEEELSYLGEYGDPEMVREMCEASNDEVNFMISLGRNYTDCHLMPPVWEYDTDETWGHRSHANLNESPEHFLLLKKEVDRMDNVKYYVETPVASLVTDEEGGVIGVKAEDGTLFRANKGVVISTASFGRNMEMNRRYNPMGYWALNYLDKLGQWGTSNQSSGNTGDGIRMAQEIGADLALSPANCCIDTSIMGYYYQECSKILVNKHGRRFVQENGNWGYLQSRVFQEAVALNDQDPETAGFYIIMDSQTVEKNDAMMAIIQYNVDASAKAGYRDKFVAQADTIEELAEMVGLPADELANTVERWNGFCDLGEDLDFNRKNVDGREDMLKINTPPYYAFKYMPVHLGSFGGLRTNQDTQVLHVNGNPIPRLYAAGATMSGMYTGLFYPACGWSILGTVHWGRKAGQQLAALEPWTEEPVETRERQTKKEIKAAAEGNYEPGTYTAVGKGRNGDIPVTVTFSETEILSVEIGENSETPGICDLAMEKIPEMVLVAQSADVDIISGATLSSNGILEAVKLCIEQAAK